MDEVEAVERCALFSRCAGRTIRAAKPCRRAADRRRVIVMLSLVAIFEQRSHCPRDAGEDGKVAPSGSEVVAAAGVMWVDVSLDGRPLTGLSCNFATRFRRQASRTLLLLPLSTAGWT